MSNPTELPDLEAVAEMLESQHAWLTNVAAANLVRKMARRAQPEGEAPQADAVLRAMLDYQGDGWEVVKRVYEYTATLSPLCGAQQAAAPADCSGTPSSCPDNEGYGCHCSAPGTPEAPKPPFPISDDEMSALRRFWECATDGEGYDVEKTMMQRLAEMGLVQRKSGAYYMVTEFGLYVLREYTIPRAAQLDGGQEGSAT